MSRYEQGSPRRHGVVRWCRRVALAAAVAAAAVVTAGAVAYALTPLPTSLAALLPADDTRILDRHGRLIADLPRGGIRHVDVAFAALPLTLRQATLAAEDNSFYSNPGIDPLAIARAAVLDLRGGALYGGSTITQQLVRNTLLPPDERSSRSLLRKLHEALLALKLTRHLGKDGILALYLNTVNYGNLTYGAEAASQLYFGRPAAQLDLAQAAMLAGLPRAPSLYDPLRHPDAARGRQLAVLRLMLQHGYITPEQERLAAAEPLRIGSAALQGDSDPAPHWVTYVLGLVSDKLGAARVAQGGLTIRTTLDLALQQAATESVRRRVAEIAQEHNAHDAAVVSIDPRSGEILAMVGSADPTNRAIDGAYNVALAPRQPGSAIKPFTYLAALDRWSPGAANLGLTPASLLDDVPTTFRAPDGSLYQPMDYDAQFLGRVPLRVALGSSLNIPAVEVLQRVGIDRMLRMAHNAGITTMYRSDRYGQALTLGGGEVTLLDLTSAYGTIADLGMRHAPRAVLSVSDAAGHELGDWSPPPAAQAFGPRGPQLAAEMTDMLSDDAARLPSFGANSLLVLPDRPAAAKTGTTFDWHDNWTVGYTPDLVTGVWVGNADNAAMERITGVTGAAPIWNDVMTAALRDVAPRPFPIPPGMVRAAVCQDTGLAPEPGCRTPTTELFIAGTEPAPPVARTQSQIAGPPSVADPPDGARFALSSAIPAAAQQIAVTLQEGATPSQQAPHGHDLQLLVDGRPAGRCRAGPAAAGQGWGSPAAQQSCVLMWPLRPGRHRLAAQAPGAMAGRAVSITVDGNPQT